MMTVVRTRRSRCCVRALTALVLGFSALLAGCGNRSTASPGTPVITLSDTSGDFATYRVAINSISLTHNNIATWNPNPQMPPEGIALAVLTNPTKQLRVQ